MDIAWQTLIVCVVLGALTAFLLFTAADIYRRWRLNAAVERFVKDAMAESERTTYAVKAFERHRKNRQKRQQPYRRGTQLGHYVRWLRELPLLRSRVDRVRLRTDPGVRW